MGTENPIVAIGALRKRYGELEVLKGIDLQVQRGEVIAIIGKSGSGKSTLLRCINGLEEFQQGTLTVDGQALRHDDAAAMRELRQHVGMIFQSFNLFPHLSVGRNVMLAPGLVKGRKGPEAESRARATAAAGADRGAGVPVVRRARVHQARRLHVLHGVRAPGGVRLSRGIAGAPNSRAGPRRRGPRPRLSAVPTGTV